MSKKSPFLIFSDILSPLDCEDFIDRNINEAHTKTFPISELNSLSDIRIESSYMAIISKVEICFDTTIEYISEGKYERYGDWVTPRIICDNSEYINGEWLKTKDIDFTIITFLNDFQDELPFDPRFEVMGGNLEFSTHNFSIHPSRGTSILFPSNNNFQYCFSKINIGELNIVKHYLTSKDPYIYNPNNFMPGNPQNG